MDPQPQQSVERDNGPRGTRRSAQRGNRHSTTGRTIDNASRRDEPRRSTRLQRAVSRELSLDQIQQPGDDSLFTSRPATGTHSRLQSQELSENQSQGGDQGGDDDSLFTSRHATETPPTEASAQRGGTQGQRSERLVLDVIASAPPSVSDVDMRDPDDTDTGSLHGRDESERDRTGSFARTRTPADEESQGTSPRRTLAGDTAQPMGQTTEQPTQRARPHRAATTEPAASPAPAHPQPAAASRPAATPQPAAPAPAHPQPAASQPAATPEPAASPSPARSQQPATHPQPATRPQLSAHPRRVRVVFNTVEVDNHPDGGYLERSFEPIEPTTNVASRLDLRQGEDGNFYVRWPDPKTREIVDFRIEAEHRTLSRVVASREPYSDAPSRTIRPAYHWPKSAFPVDAPEMKMVRDKVLIAEMEHSLVAIDAGAGLTRYTFVKLGKKTQNEGPNEGPPLTDISWTTKSYWNKTQNGPQGLRDYLDATGLSGIEATFEDERRERVARRAERDSPAPLRSAANPIQTRDAPHASHHRNVERSNDAINGRVPRGNARGTSRRGEPPRDTQHTSSRRNASDLTMRSMGGFLAAMLVALHVA